MVWTMSGDGEIDVSDPETVAGTRQATPTARGASRVGVCYRCVNTLFDFAKVRCGDFGVAAFLFDDLIDRAASCEPLRHRRLHPPPRPRPKC